MPDLYLHSVPSWCPQSLSHTLSRDARGTSRQRFTSELGEELREAVVPELFERVWNHRADNVKLFYVELSGRSIGTPDIFIVLRPLYTHERFSTLDPMLDSLGTRVQELCRIVAKRCDAEVPSLTIDVDFKFGGGVTLQQSGVISGRWTSEPLPAGVAASPQLSSEQDEEPGPGARAGWGMADSM